VESANSEELNAAVSQGQVYKGEDGTPLVRGGGRSSPKGSKHRLFEAFRTNVRSGHSRGGRSKTEREGDEL